MTKVVAVIPAYQEEQRIAQSVHDARGFVDAVVVVDDCSTDGTARVAQRAGAHVLRHVLNRGQGAALQTGTDFALRALGADVVVHFDADGQMQASDIPSMIAPILSGEADVVLGSRFLGIAAHNMPASRRMILWGARIFTLLVSGIRLTDAHNGFRVLSRMTAEKMRISIDRMAHASEILDNIVTLRLRYVERPVTIRYTADTLAKGQYKGGAVRVVKDMLKKRLIG